MIDEIQKRTAGRMAKSIEVLKQDLAKLRTGRAHTSLLEHIRVSCYGTDMPINQVANIAVSDTRTLTVTPWDKSVVTIVEKAIRDSDLGLNPVTAGTVIRVPLPPLTEERRRDLVRVVRADAENARVAIRNVRRDAIAELKQLVKDRQISEDQERRAEEQTQKLTDKYVAEVDKVLHAKEEEVMTV
jgi:ribosome recycling factor